MEQKRGRRRNIEVGFGDFDALELKEAAENQTLRYSNFLITLSSNVKPLDESEKMSIVFWFQDNAFPLFNDWDLLNGTVLKPAGTANSDKEDFPEDHLIISVRSRFTVEQGDLQRGQVHAHVVMEVAHEYVRQQHGATGFGDEGKEIIGVHVNVSAIRGYLNEKIILMDVPADRRPKKIYVNSKLLTSGTDNSNKFLSFQYINKDVAKDNGGGTRNLKRDREEAPEELQRVYESVKNGGIVGTEIRELQLQQQATQEAAWRDYDLVGGALIDSPPVQKKKIRYRPPTKKN